MAAYLVKPIRQAALRKAILSAMGNAPSSTTIPVRPYNPDVDEARPLHILLAEDNPMNQKLAVTLLERHRHTVVVAGNGVDAIAAWEHETFDLALFDVQMPEMDGLEATRFIRKRERIEGGHLPIIAMTAAAMKSDYDQCFAAGMDGYVSKPFRANELWQAIEKLVPSHPAPAVPGSDIKPEDRAINAGSAPQSPASAMPAQDSMVDWTAALANVGGDESLLRELTAIFLKESPEWMKTIEEAIAENDRDSLRLTAHKLKGALETLAASSVAAQARTLELIARGNTSGDPVPVFAELQHQLRQLTNTLSQKSAQS